MNSDSYWYRTLERHIIRIGTSPSHENRWAIWFNDMLVCDDFGSAEEAALRAHQREFQSFRKTNVPEDLNLWARSEPEKLPKKESEPRLSDSCENRPWKPGLNRPRF